MKNIITATLFLSLFILSASSSALAEEFCRPCPFDCISIGVGSDHCSSRGVFNGLCCVDLDNDGQDQLRYYQDNRGRRPGGIRGQGIRQDGRFDGRFDGRRGGTRFDGRRGGGRFDRFDRRRDGRRGGAFNGIRDGRRDGRRRGDRRDFNNANTLNSSNECPSGFSPRDNRCSDSERANGCQDTKSASGRSCIRWGRPQNSGRSGRNLALECPTGFTYRANRCSAVEKVRGCKDTRSRSGASCVKF